jgi:hypothetical protein
MATRDDQILNRRPRMTRSIGPTMAVALLMVLTVAGGGISAAANGPTPPPAGASVATTSGSTTTAPSVPLSPALAQWKQKYLYVIGHLADDALVVVTDGTKGKKHPTKAQAKAQVKKTLAACRTWQQDARKAGSKAPPIPSATAQADWKRLVSSSEAASSDCVTSFKTGSKKAAKRFRTQLAVVNKSEGQLTAIFAG